jgi:hypothetical protein
VIRCLNLSNLVTESDENFRVMAIFQVKSVKFEENFMGCAQYT